MSAVGGWKDEPFVIIGGEQRALQPSRIMGWSSTIITFIVFVSVKGILLSLV